MVSIPIAFYKSDTDNDGHIHIDQVNKDTRYRLKFY